MHDQIIEFQGKLNEWMHSQTWLNPGKSEEEILLEREYHQYLLDMNETVYDLQTAVFNLSSKFMDQRVRDHYENLISLPGASMRSSLAGFLDAEPFNSILDFVDPHRPRFDVERTKSTISHRLVNTFILHLKAKDASD